MQSASLQSRGYLPVATESLRPASVLNCDLFLQRSGCNYTELFRGSTYPLEQGDIDQLRTDGVEKLYIRAEEANNYHSYLRERVLSDPTVPPAVRMQALREVTRVAFQDALTANDSDKIVASAAQFGSDLASVVAERSLNFRELFGTLEHDYYTFTHVCNVSVYCTVLAHKMGACPADQLGDFAAAALLHDIGKRHIPAHILNKAEKLTDAEWELIREHPVTGFREVATREDLSWDQLMVIYQHHERMDGSGYPAGIQGDEVHPWARICAVVDVFDALTCHRPYRGPVPRHEVCEYLSKHAGVWFDAGAVACWISHVRSAA